MDNLNCRDCPYGKEDFERRMYWYNKIVEERGIPNDIYHDLQPEDVVDEFEQFLWCDKVCDKVYYGIVHVNWVLTVQVQDYFISEKMYMAALIIIVIQILN